MVVNNVAGDGRGGRGDEKWQQRKIGAADAVDGAAETVGHRRSLRSLRRQRYDPGRRDAIPGQRLLEHRRSRQRQ